MAQHNIINLLFTFEGRISRGQFWIGTVLVALGVILTYGIALAFLPSAFYYIFIFFMNGFFCLASTSIGIKRLHDRNKSGWWLLLSWIPLFGTIWYFLEAGFFESVQDNNRFGDAPLPTITAVI